MTTREKPTRSPSPETPDRKEWSPLAADAREEFIDGVKEITTGFYDDMKGDNPASGFGGRKEAMKSVRIEALQSHIGAQFNRLVDRMVANFDRTLDQEDQKYREELAAANSDEARIAIEEKYQERYARVAELGAKELEALVGDVEEMGDRAENASEFLRLYFPALENIDIEARARSYEEVEVALERGDIDVEYVEDAYGKIQTMLEKLEAETPLDEADYDEILAQLSPFLDTHIQTDESVRTEETLRGIEGAGVLTVLHAMTPAQRMEFARYFVKDEEWPAGERRQAVLFLASADYLSASQAMALFEETSDIELLTPEEKTQIETAQQMVEELRARAAEQIKHSPSGNLFGNYFTSSNVLIYEIFGRIAVIGMALSLGLNLNRIPSTVTNPIFLAMAAVAGVSYEHITGGVGRGGISQTIAGAQAEKPDEKSNEEIGLERLAGLMSGHPETVRFLRADNGARLADIHRLAALEKDGGVTYNFKFDHLIDDILEKENARNDWTDAHLEERRKELEATYKQGLDEKTVAATEAAISRIYQTLRGPLSLTELSDMLDVFEQAEQHLGL